MKGQIQMNNFKLHLLVIGCMLAGLCSPAWAADPILPPGTTQTGSISSPGQVNSYTLNASAGDVVDFTVAVTSGALSPEIQLYNGAGTLIDSASNRYLNGVCAGGSTMEMDTVTIPVSGIYIVNVLDCSNTNTGSYNIYAQFTNSPVWGNPLSFGQTLTGKIGLAAQSNTYTFSANANDSVDFTMVETSGTPSPKLRLYNPDGSLLSSASNNYLNGVCAGGSTIEMNTVTIPKAGTYTLLVGDCSDTNTGSYTIYAQRTNNPALCVDLVWGQVQSGAIGSVAQSNCFTFSGTASDVVDFTMVATNGNVSPKLRLYNPDGSLLSSASNNYLNGVCAGGSTIEMNSVTLKTNGTHTLLVGDCSDTNPGAYNLTSQCFGACLLPVPTTTLLSPGSALAGGPGFTLTVNGSGFANNESNSVVQWDGGDLTTTFVSTSQLTAAVPGTDIATAGTFLVTVSTPGPGGGTSLPPLLFTVNNPPPGPISVSPASATAGGPAFTLTVNGTNFVKSSQVMWNGISLATTYVSATQLTALVPAADIAIAGSVPVTVFNPAPGGGTSPTPPPTFIINNPVPGAISLLPPSATAGGPAFTLTVTGTNFVQNSTVNWNGSGLATTYVSATQLTALVPATDIAITGTVPVTVFNPAPGGGTSPAPIPTFTINNPVPMLTLLSPASAVVGGPALTLTVTGSKFVAGSVVKWNGSGLATTYVSATQLTALVPAIDIAIAGFFLVTVFNPVPGGGPSNPLTFTVGDNPPPVLTSLSPSSATAGGPAFTLTLTGSSFIKTSAVYWNQTKLTTTYVSATQLTALVPATDIATAGTVPVTVVNPAPGGGTSSPQIFTINNPLPILTSLSPSSATEGGPAFTLTLKGSNFVKTSSVYWNLIKLTTTYVSATELQAAVPAADIATAGTVQVTAFNPTPGGGTSSPQPFTINFPPAAPPVFSPGGGAHLSPQSVTVTITDTTPGATIYYTIDGTTPTTSSTKYSGAISVIHTETIEAIAVASGYANSPVAKAIYTFIAATPVITPTTGTYTSAKSVTIKDVTPGAVIYYTTDGTVPTTASTEYTSAISVDASETIEAIAVAPGYNNSAIAKAVYTLIGSPSALSAPATAISTPNATLNAWVNTLGLTGSYIFQYGTTSTLPFATSTAKTTLSASTTAVAASAQLTNLQPKTTYYFQVVVTTAGGTSSGAVLHFATN